MKDDEKFPVDEQWDFETVGKAFDIWAREDEYIAETGDTEFKKLPFDEMINVLEEYFDENDNNLR